MNPMASVKVEGVDDLLADFKKYKVQAKKAIKRGVDHTARAITYDAKQKLKADHHWITGRLHTSVHPEFKQGENHGDDTLNEQIGEMEAVVGTNVVYAMRIEFGFKGADSLGRVYNQEPSSYLGYSAVKNDKNLRKWVDEELNKVTKG